MILVVSKFQWPFDEFVGDGVSASNDNVVKEEPPSNCANTLATLTEEGDENANRLAKRLK